MNKKLIIALLATSLLIPVSAHAADPAPAPAPAIAVLDTAIDDTLSIFQGKIVDEVCIIDWTTCPNGKNFMEGQGAAYMPPNLIKLNGFEHGTQMTSIVLAKNPNVKIVFIKIIGNTATGQRQISFESAVYNALNWVYANKDKWNIQAVTMSQGHHNLGAAGTDYCPKTPTTKASVQKLMSVGIPTFFPAGNGRDYQRLDWPACIDESISVGAVDQVGDITSYSNFDSSKLDFLALGNLTATLPGGTVVNVAGTSASTAVAAAQWVLVKQSKPSLSYADEYSLLTSKAVVATGRQGSAKKLIDLGASLG
jgi:hypothetical protein